MEKEGIASAGRLNCWLWLTRWAVIPFFVSLRGRNVIMSFEKHPLRKL